MSKKLENIIFFQQLAAVGIFVVLTLTSVVTHHSIIGIIAMLVFGVHGMVVGLLGAKKGWPFFSHLHRRPIYYGETASRKYIWYQFVPSLLFIALILSVLTANNANHGMPLPGMR